MAQSNIVPDNTLGSEASRVIFNFNGTPNEVIGGGAQRGQNLFHSFREFNVGENRGAYFFVFDPNIQNILARVTGSNRSEILGTLGTRQVIDGNFFRSNANLFLMNPNGIIFGGNASLDINGSFYGTTANGIQFGNQGNFSTINPQTPGVLTVNPSALFFDAVAKQGVINVNQSLLGVAPGKNLALLGGDISLNNSTLKAFGGRIELGASGGTGTVGINQDGSFSLPESLTRANISISNSLLDVTADNGGSIAINAGNLNISGSTIQAGISSGLGTVDSQAGDITINSTGKLQIAPQSFIRNWVFPNAIGKGGDIRINTDSMTFNGFGSGYISASTWGKGDAGSVVVNAENDITLNGSLIFSIGETGADGNAGNIDISTQNLLVTFGGQLSTSILGKGDAGNVTINARDRITLESTSPNGQFPSAIYSEVVNSTSEGNGGNINITTGSLFVKNGAQLRANTNGKGNAGNISIEAGKTIYFDGISFNGETFSGAFSLISNQGEGNGGDIDIRTNSFSISNGARISAATFGKGNAGNINIEAQDRVIFVQTTQNNILSGIFSTVELGGEGNGGNIDIQAGSLLITEGSRVTASTFGTGDTGNIRINVRDRISLTGTNANGNFFSGILNTTEGVKGDSNDINITADSLFVTEGGIVATSSLSEGRAGNITINTKNIVVDGISSNGAFTSGIFSTIEPSGKGEGGNIGINTNLLTLNNGGVINASTSGRGNAGSIKIDADDITLKGTTPNGRFTSGLASGTTAIGSSANAGNVTLTTRLLNIRDGALISTQTFNQGKGGDLNVTARESINLAGTSTLSSGQVIRSGLFTTTSGLGAAGNIKIFDTGLIQMQNGGQVLASTSGLGKGGTIDVTADRIELEGISTNQKFPSGFGSETSFLGSSANAGDVTLTTRILNIRNGARISTESFNQGQAGNLTVTASESLNITGVGIQNTNTVGSGLFTSTRNSGAAGNLRIVNTGLLKVQDGGSVRASTLGQGSGGNLEVTADTVDLIGLSANGLLRSGLASETTGIGSRANAGNVTLTTRLLNIRDGALISTITSNQGQGGDLNIIARESINVAGTGTLSTGQPVRSGLITEAFGSGAAGNLKIFDTGLIKIEDGAGISASTFGQGRGGNIDVTADSLELEGVSFKNLSRSFLGSETAGISPNAKSGDVTLTTRILNIRDGALISTDASNQGQGGNLTVTARESLNVLGTSTIAKNSFQIFYRSALSTGTIGSGAAGNLNITDTGQILIADGAVISASTSGQGKGGNININADSFDLKGISTNGRYRSVLESETKGTDSNANAGDITIKTRNLNIRDGALISTETSNQGKGGNLTVTATESLQISGITSFSNGGFFRSAISTLTQGSGEAGNLKIIDTGLIRIQEGAAVFASSIGQGKGGNINIDADSVELSGASANGRFLSFLGSETTAANSRAEAGDVTITARNLNIRDGALISTRTLNQGQGGSLTVTVRESLNIFGTSTQNGQVFSSGLFTSTSGLGASGNIKVFDTNRIVISSGGQISASTTGSGQGGNIEVNADTIELIGVSNTNQAVSALASETSGKDSIANAGDITVTSRLLSIRDGARISTQTFNQGRAGNLTINARESLNILGTGTQNGQIFGSGLFTSTAGLGASGNIKIFDTNRIVIGSGGQISASTFGEGKGGNIEVNADTIELIGVSNNNQVVSAFASETSGKDSIANAGDITLTSRILNIRDGALISTQTFNQGRGGNLTINARESLNISGTGTQNSRIVGSRLSTETSASGASGDLRIIDTGSIRIEGGGTISASNRGQGHGGNIEINADTLEIFGIASNGQFVSAIGSETSGANSSTDAGDITITARNLNIRDRGLISTRSFNQGKAGNININVDKNLNLTNGNILTFSRQSSGGSVNVNAENIRFFGDSNISTSVVSGAGGGGDIKLTANSILAFGDSDIFAFAQDGKGGNITFDTPAFFGQNYRPATPGTNPLTLEENNRVDINASGAVSGVIVLPDTGFVQNNLGKLPQDAIDTNALIANSCIARRNQQQNGSFFITGSGGVAVRPGDAPLPSYSTGDVQPIPAESTTLPTQKRPWQIGDRVIEPTGVYELPNGKLVLGKEC
ncbi:filamentous hemagglutinin N-terminal domain-containing protein [Calothrix sp. FACHB-1219]|uniref:two-partner secretion domain-containing protein n=1 Tax=unclassified Calothrix TaxID=2619626 RepID=UPI0016830605|nr:MULTISPECIES: filamentous hemagglutinin N-terminal domain-containing protein [unclassified Calothrix]MBD2207861.1 filamentous hemagglutinin N-terminal domain-containing protein [Calothrix sp. FACHB-168]MBD2222461.1 filamentous hemagglutinin N-terminal domain-containing protein [Calothrix sp. FACHB-1219]